MWFSLCLYASDRSPLDSHIKRLWYTESSSNSEVEDWYSRQFCSLVSPAPIPFTFYFLCNTKIKDKSQSSSVCEFYTYKDRADNRVGVDEGDKKSLAKRLERNCWGSLGWCSVEILYPSPGSTQNKYLNSHFPPFFFSLTSSLNSRRYIFNIIWLWWPISWEGKKSRKKFSVFT